MWFPPNHLEADVFLHRGHVELKNAFAVVGLAREKAPQKVRKTICFLIDIDKVCKTRSLQVNYISLVFGWQKKQAPFTGFFFTGRQIFVEGREWHGSHPTERWGWLHVRWWRWASAGAQMIFWKSKGPKTRGFSPVFSRKWPAFLRVAGGKRGIVAVPCCDECELKHWLWDGVKRLVFLGKVHHAHQIQTSYAHHLKKRCIFFKWVGSNAN